MYSPNFSQCRSGSSTCNGLRDGGVKVGGGMEAGRTARQPRLVAKSLASTDNATRDNEFRICHKAILRPCALPLPLAKKI